MIKSLTILNGGNGNDYIFEVGKKRLDYEVIEIEDRIASDGCYIVKFDGGEFEVRATNVIVLRTETENSKMFKQYVL